MQNKDLIIKNMLSFLQESSRLKKIHIDGIDFYLNYEGCKSCKGKNIGEIT